MKDLFMESLHPIIQKNGTVAIYYNGALEQLHTLKMLLSEKRINIKVFYFEPNIQNESKNNQLLAVYKHNQTLLETFKTEHNISVIKLPVFEYLDINLDDPSKHHFVLEEIYSGLGEFDAIIIHDETSLVHFQTVLMHSTNSRLRKVGCIYPYKNIIKKGFYPNIIAQIQVLQQINFERIKYDNQRLIHAIENYQPLEAFLQIDINIDPVAYYVIYKLTKEQQEHFFKSISILVSRDMIAFMITHALIVDQVTQNIITDSIEKSKFNQEEIEELIINFVKIVARPNMNRTQACITLIEWYKDKISEKTMNEILYLSFNFVDHYNQDLFEHVLSKCGASLFDLIVRITFIWDAWIVLKRVRLLLKQYSNSLSLEEKGQLIEFYRHKKHLNSLAQFLTERDDLQRRIANTIKNIEFYGGQQFVFDQSVMLSKEQLISQESCQRLKKNTKKRMPSDDNNVGHPNISLIHDLDQPIFKEPLKAVCGLLGFPIEHLIGFETTTIEPGEGCVFGEYKGEYEPFWTMSLILEAKKGTIIHNNQTDHSISVEEGLGLCLLHKTKAGIDLDRMKRGSFCVESGKIHLVRMHFSYYYITHERAIEKIDTIKNLPKPVIKPKRKAATPLKCGCFVMVRNTYHLDYWVQYHKKIGINEFAVYFDEPEEDFKNIELLHADPNVTLFKSVVPNNWYSSLEQVRRQYLNRNHAIKYLKSRGCDWVFCIDEDELLYTLSGKTLQQTLESKREELKDVINIKLNLYESLKLYGEYDEYNFFKYETYFYRGGLHSYGGLDGTDPNKNVKLGKSAANTLFVDDLILPDTYKELVSIRETNDNKINCNHYVVHKDGLIKNHYHDDIILLHYPFNIYSRYKNKVFREIKHRTNLAGLYNQFQKMNNSEIFKADDLIKNAFKEKVMFTESELHNPKRLVKSRIYRFFPDQRFEEKKTEYKLNYLNKVIRIDPYKVTPLCEIMEKNGSDKGKVDMKNAWHNYTTLYYSLFKSRRKSKIRLFELGVNSNNPNFANTRGPHAKIGASLYGWKEFFTEGEIFGGDIDKDCLFSSKRIKTFFCDSRNAATIKKMWSHKDFKTKMDIIIDDGYHNFEANRCFLENSIHQLNENGIFIIEDIQNNEKHLFIKKIKEWNNIFPNYIFDLIEIPSLRNKQDNNIIYVSPKKNKM